MSEAKPGPCPACGKVTEDHLFVWTRGQMSDIHFAKCNWCGLCGPSASSREEAITKFNAIRARVLREAAEMIESQRAIATLRAAADRAERGE